LPLTLVFAALAGCASVETVADRVLAPAKPAPISKEWEPYRGEAWIDVSPKPFQYFLVPAGAMQSTVTFGVNPSLRFSFQFRSQPNQKGPSSSARGTVVMLHGFGLDAASMAFLQMAASTREFDALAIELRNHGGSPALPLGFGADEGRDVVKIIDALRAQSKLREPLHFIGYSYGATAALHAAKALGEDVPVIAIAPFNQADAAVIQTLMWLRSEMSFFARATLPSTDRLPLVAGAIGKKLGTDLKSINTANAVRGMKNCVLLFGGTADEAITLAQVNEIHVALPRSTIIRFTSPHDGLMLLASINGFALVDWLANSRDLCVAPPEIYQPPETTGE
jgi:pimeloyl-ACP methyl ester carboxylesterase